MNLINVLIIAVPLLLIALLIIFYFIYKRQCDYKVKVYKRTFKKNFPGLVYSPSEYTQIFPVPQQMRHKVIYSILHKCLNPNTDYMAGKNLIYGDTPSGVPFQYSDIKLIREDANDTRSISNGTGLDYTFFEGAILSSHARKVSDTPVWVCVKENMLPAAVNKEFAELHKISTENIAFNNVFNVFCGDEETAFYILTPQVIELLLKMKGVYGTITVEFYDGCANVILPWASFFVEPKEYSYAAIDKQAELCSQWLGRYINFVDVLNK